ncbi:MAG TPA: carotenoid biosynthesis protein [Blastocatellia bacterium]
MKHKLIIRSLPLTGLILAYVVMWIGGVGHYALIGGPPLDAPWAASVFLLLAGVIVVVTSAKRDLPGLVAAATLGFIAEILGVHYGFIFSPYNYTSVLQPQLLGVPLVMLSAWMVLVAYVRQMLAGLKLSVWLEAVLAAAWMTAIDLVIDPLAANQLGYWRWEQSGAYYGIPLHNFIGWFVVSLLIFCLVRRRWEENVIARYVGLSIVLFFSAIALSYNLWLAGGVGILLALAHFVLSRPVMGNRFVPLATDSLD